MYQQKRQGDGNPLALRELLVSRQSPWCLADHAILYSAALTGVSRVYTIDVRELNPLSLIRDCCFHLRLWKSDLPSLSFVIRLVASWKEGHHEPEEESEL